MPIYEYYCGKCKKPFTVVLTFAEFDKKRRKPKCPKCKKSTEVERLIGGVQVKTSKKS